MRIYSYGRLKSCPARLWERAIRQTGDVRTMRLRDADLVVIGSGAANRSAGDILALLSEARSGGRGVSSELAFLRSLRLAPPLPSDNLAYGLGELASLTKLSPTELDLLASFDVIEGEGGRFGFRAIKAAAAASRLLREGFALAEIIAATQRMREALSLSSPLSQLPVGPDESGHLVLRLAEGMAELDGQLRLKIDGAPADVEDLLAAAGDARDSAQPRQAETLLRRALAAAPAGPEILFELGSLLCEQDAFAEGVALLQKAAALKPDLADAWFNIGCALERQNRPAEASLAYQRAVAADPGYADPLYNLGMLALDEKVYEEAARWLERYLRFDRRSEWAAKARKGLMLARLSRSAAVMASHK